MSITRPLKAPNDSVSDKDLHKLSYPLLGSTKIDGFRCVIVDSEARTSSMKLVPNPYVGEILSHPELNDLDGELVVGKPDDENAFHNSTGPLRRTYGLPDFTFWVFDNFLYPDVSYFQRWINLDKSNYLLPHVKILPQVLLRSPEDVISFTNQCIEKGFEGAMIRSPNGFYKQGRATFNEMNIFKRKPLEDMEAVVIGFVEQQTNLNPKYTDEMGLTKRRSNQENKVGAETLGSFIMKALKWPKPFNCGGGRLSHSERKYIWDHQAKFMHKIATFAFQAYGSIDAPRQPIFKRWYKTL